MEKSGDDDDDDRTITDIHNSKWFSMKTTITGLAERLDLSNVQLIAREMSNLNLSPGRGLFCQAVMKSQMSSPQSSNIYAALVAIINPQFPDVGRLLVTRLALQFKEGYDSKNKEQMEISLNFIAHLVNQAVVYETLAVTALWYLLVNPCSDNLELAVDFCTQCGWTLLHVSPHKLKEVLGEFRRLLMKGKVERRIQKLILKLFVVRKSKFKKYPGIIDELLDLDDEIEDQTTHEVTFFNAFDPEDYMDDFMPDSKFDDVP